MTQTTAQTLADRIEHAPHSVSMVNRISIGWVSEAERDLIIVALRSYSPDKATPINPTGERIHDLKTWPKFFDAIATGDKTFEVRKDDRGFRAGDYLRLREWHPHTKAYGGREIVVHVTYLLCDPLFGIERGYVCMAIKPVSSGQGAGINERG